jgi:hypothetical protein
MIRKLLEIKLLFGKRNLKKFLVESEIVLNKG